MRQPHVVVVGGGLAGLSAGVYAQASGFRTTLLEHGDALGGVCTSWQRGPYTIDGCIRWLTVGPFARLYAELGIVPRVRLRALEQLVTYRSAQGGPEVGVTRDLSRLHEQLRALGPHDAGELTSLIDAARRVVELEPGIQQPHELSSWREALGAMWDARQLTRYVRHLDKPISVYAAEHLRSVPLRRLLTRLLPEDSSALFLALMLGYLERGDLCRPIGGTAAFRDALVSSFRELSGEAMLSATVEEIVVEHGNARGVRLRDGSLIQADHVVCTSSVPETILHLLGRQHGLAQYAEEMAQWRLYGPVLQLSLGVSRPLRELPSMLVVDNVQPFQVAGRAQDSLSLRIFNDAPDCAPEGHTVVQTLLTTNYDYWAMRRDAYAQEKERVADAVQEALVRQLPTLHGAVQMRDVATPLTYWRIARSWRGAYERWRPRSASLFGQVDKLVAGLDNLYLAGQWVEPGGGIPVSLLSGRHAVQLLCARAGLRFVPGIA